MLDLIFSPIAYLFSLENQPTNLSEEKNALFKKLQTIHFCFANLEEETSLYKSLKSLKAHIVEAVSGKELEILKKALALLEDSNQKDQAEIVASKVNEKLEEIEKSYSDTFVAIERDRSGTLHLVDCHSRFIAGRFCISPQDLREIRDVAPIDGSAAFASTLSQYDERIRLFPGHEEEVSTSELTSIIQNLKLSIPSAICVEDENLKYTEIPSQFATDLPRLEHLKVNDASKKTGFSVSKKEWEAIKSDDRPLLIKQIYQNLLSLFSNDESLVFNLCKILNQGIFSTPYESLAKRFFNEGLQRVIAPNSGLTFTVALTGSKVKIEILQIYSIIDLSAPCKLNFLKAMRTINVDKECLKKGSFSPENAQITDSFSAFYKTIADLNKKERLSDE